MTSKTISNGILRAVGTLILIAIGLYFIYEIQSVIAYILIAAVVSLLGKPVVDFLNERLKFKKLLAVIITMLLFLGLFAGIIGLLIPLLLEQGQNLSLLDIDALRTNIEGLYIQSIEYLQLHHINTEKAISDSNILSNLDYGAIPDFLNSLLAGLGSFSIGLLSVLFIAFFFLKDSKLFRNAILSFVPSKNELKVKHSLLQISSLLSRYFVGLFFQLFILFVIYTIGLLVVGAENAVVIAFLCALVNIIPYLGPLIGGILMLFLVTTDNIAADFETVVFPKLLFTLIVITVGQLVDNFFSQPFIFSKSVKSHPLEIFLIIIIAGLLFGVVGMIVAVPVYTAIKVILKEFLYDYKFVKTLTKGI